MLRHAKLLAKVRNSPCSLNGGGLHVKYFSRSCLSLEKIDDRPSEKVNLPRKTFLHNLADRVSGEDTTLEQWKTRINATVKHLEEEEKRQPKSRFHRHLFALIVMTLPVYVLLELLLYFDDRHSKHLEQQLGAVLKNEGSFTLFNLDLYSSKPTKDVRETQALNREKFYSNREVARMNFEKLSYTEQVKQLKDNIKQQQP